VSPKAKLFLVGREDLPAGLLAAQFVHAQRQFQDEHADLERAWYTTSNTLALLSVQDERALIGLADLVRQSGVAMSVWREPDLADAVTAIAIAPDGRKYVRRLPLALSAVA
jgi:peptidyl-tRNA hydrolase